VGGKAELHFAHSNLSAEKDAPERDHHEHNARITGQVTRSRTAARAELHLGLGAREERSQLRARTPWQRGVAHRHASAPGRPRRFWTTHAALEREYEARL
jgi:hypothetical protein